MRKTGSEILQDTYMNLKNAGNKYGGLYILDTPIFMPIDLYLIKIITVREFQSFHDRDVYLFEEVDPLTGHLFSLQGEKWRNIRTKLTPSFTSTKMKMMYSLFLTCAEQLELVVEEAARRSECIDIKDIMTRYSIDVIGLIAFGLDLNSLKEPEGEFRKHCKLMLDNSIICNIRNLCIVAAPNLLKYFKISYTTPKVRQFFLDTIQQTLDSREKNNIERKDFLDNLMKLKINENVSNHKDNIKPDVKEGDTNCESGLTFHELAAQAFMFLIAGFETSSNTLAFCFYELCVNQEIQDKVRKEVCETLTRHNGQCVYEAIMEMEYLDKVVKETLRKYPIIGFLNRKCVQDYKIPDSSVVIQKGTRVMISVLGLHRDPEYYPDPVRFDPHRFSEEARISRPPFTYMPFGEGPRNCIGIRVALQQIKLGIVSLLRNYKFTLEEKSVLPVTLDPALPFLSAKTKIWMHVEKIVE